MNTSDPSPLAQDCPVETQTRPVTYPPGTLFPRGAHHPNEVPYDPPREHNRGIPPLERIAREQRQPLPEKSFGGASGRPEAGETPSLLKRDLAQSPPNDFVVHFFFADED